MTELYSFCGESFQHFSGLENMLSTSLNIEFSPHGKVYFVFCCSFTAFHRRASSSVNNKKIRGLSTRFSRSFSLVFFYCLHSLSGQAKSLFPSLSKKVYKKSCKHAEEHKTNHYAGHYLHAKLSIFHNTTSLFIFYFLRNI